MTYPSIFGCSENDALACPPIPVVNSIEKLSTAQLSITIKGRGKTTSCGEQSGAGTGLGILAKAEQSSVGASLSSTTISYIQESTLPAQSSA